MKPFKFQRSHQVRQTNGGKVTSEANFTTNIVSIGEDIKISMKQLNNYNLINHKSKIV